MHYIIILNKILLIFHLIDFINTLFNITKYNLYTENSIEKYNVLMCAYNHNCSDKILDKNIF